MNITIGIPTYNRKSLLDIMSNSLKASDLPKNSNIRVYDDCSNEFDRNYLESLFPTASTITINNKNLKSDHNIYQMYVDFLSTNDEYFFNADSDLIFNNQWLNIALDYIKETDGILSVFNANSHEVTKVVNDNLCIKNHIGSAGTLFTRDRVEEIVDHFNSADDVANFDWQWSEFFKMKGVKIFCLNNSQVQHIGFEGQNSKSYFDVGIGYSVENQNQGQILNDTLVAAIDRVRSLDKKRILEEQELHAEQVNNFWYHFKRCFLIIAKNIIPKTVLKKFK